MLMSTKKKSCRILLPKIDQNSNLYVVPLLIRFGICSCRDRQARLQCSLRQLLKLINIMGRLVFILESNIIWIGQATMHSNNNLEPSSRLE